MEIPFLAHNHPVWQAHTDPIVRVKPQLEKLGLNIRLVPCPFHPGIPEPLWPSVPYDLENARRNQLVNITKAVIATNPKTIIAHHRTITTELLNSGIPLIVCENTDAPTLEWSRYFLHRDNIKAVVKTSTFRHQDMYNAEYCEGMYQGKLLWGLDHRGLQLPRMPYKAIDLALLAKVKLGYSYGSFPHHKALALSKINYDAPRKYDFSMMANINYPRSKTITAHRSKCLAILNKITGLNGFIKEHTVSHADYMNVMLQTKVCISPLGLGVCHRSFEGIYAGCVVVQPYCSYFKTEPDVYEDGVNYISCKIDMSDMEEKIRHIVSHWSDYQSMREQNKEKFVAAYWDENNLANQIYKTLSL